MVPSDTPGVVASHGDSDANRGRSQAGRPSVAVHARGASVDVHYPVPDARPRTAESRRGDDPR